MGSIKTLSKIGFFLFCAVSTNVHAQSVQEVKWTQNYTWQQIKDKARNENRFIFLDCFTTWCGPCKRMDQQVYTNDTIAEFVSEKYIPVKVQMDRTNKDAEQIKEWYSTAVEIEKQFKVNSYPTYIFLSPDGALIGKESGFKDVGDFMKLLQTVLEPGRKYVNPYAKYDSLAFEYRNGNKQYDQLPYIITTAKKIGENEFADTLSQDYYSYVMKLPASKIYTKDNIEFLAYNIRKKNDKTFSLFYPDGHKVDAIMKQKGYAQQVVDRVIKREFVNPFLEREKTNDDPDWDAFFQKVKSEYNASLAEYAVIAGKVRLYSYFMYTKGKNYQDQYIKLFMLQVEKYGVDRITFAVNIPEGGGISFGESRDIALNGVAYEIFEKSTDTNEIKSAIKWMKCVVDRSLSIGKPWAASTRDTYANLLYKIGRKEEAIELEQQAVNYATEAKSEGQVEEFQLTLQAMKSGKQI